jgi:hypothetical protein
MRKLLILLFLMFLFSCEKDVFCWMCYVRDNKTNELIKTKDFCGVSDNDILTVSAGLNVTGVSYTICNKL